MKFRQFAKWCNDRACDGRWGLSAAIICSNIVETIYKQPFWKREKIWQDTNEELKIVKNYVEPINKLIADSVR